MRREKLSKIWVKFENMEVFQERENELKELCKRLNEDHPGDCGIMVYIKGDNLISKSCVRGCCLDDDCVKILSDTFGADNVKLTTETVKKFSIYENVERIAGALERMVYLMERRAKIDE